MEYYRDQETHNAVCSRGRATGRILPKNHEASQYAIRQRLEAIRPPLRWAASRSGFNPTLAGGGVLPELAAEKRNEYFRVEVACLEVRGYSVK